MKKSVFSSHLKEEVKEITQRESALLPVLLFYQKEQQHLGIVA